MGCVRWARTPVTVLLIVAYIMCGIMGRLVMDQPVRQQRLFPHPGCALPVGRPAVGLVKLEVAERLGAAEVEGVGRLVRPDP